MIVPAGLLREYLLSPFFWLLKPCWRFVILPLSSLLSHGWKTWLSRCKARPFATISATFPVVLTMAAAFAIIVATLLRFLSPQVGVIVAPIEIPSDGIGPFAITSGGVANLLVDEMLSVRDSGDDAIRSISATSHAELQNVILFLRPAETLAIEPEMFGFSTQKIKYYWRRIRQSQYFVTGEIAFGADGITLRARLDTGLTRTVGPFPATETDFRNACRELAISLLTNLDPQMVGLFYLNKQEYSKAVDVLRRWAMQSTTADVHAYLGTGLLYQEKVEEGISNLEKAVSSGRSLPKGLLAATRSNLCAAYLYKDRLADAKEQCRAAVELSPRMSSALNNYASVLNRSGDHIGAIEYYRKALDANPGFVPSRKSLAWNLVLVRRCKEAAQIILSYSGYESNSDLLNGLGIAYACQGRWSDAVRYYKEALALDPASVPILINVGGALGTSGQYDQGASYLKRALDLKPNPYHTYVVLDTLSGVLGQKGDLDAASGYASRAIELRPDVGDAYFTLGTCLRKKRQLNEALVAIRKGLSLDPSSAHGLNELGVTLGEAGKNLEAIATFDAALKLEPNDAKLHGNRALVLLHEGEVNQAILGFNRAISLDSTYAPAHWNLAIALMRKEGMQAARASFNRAIALNPSNLRNLIELGNSTLQEGKHQLALEILQQAVAEKPDSAEAHYGLGKALQKVGRSNEAARELAEAGRLTRIK